MQKADFVISKSTYRVISGLALILLTGFLHVPAYGQLTVDDCFPPPTDDGNAADDYMYVINNIKWDEFILSKERDTQGRAEYNLDEPLLNRLVMGSHKKECHFYPDHFPFPEIGKIDEMQYPDMQKIFDLCNALAMRGCVSFNKGNFDSAHSDINAAYWMGRHVCDEYASLGQSLTGKVMMLRAFEAFYGLSMKADKVNPNYYAMNLIVTDELDGPVRKDLSQRAPWSYIENAQLAAQVLKEGPKWYWAHVIILSGIFAKAETMEMPEKDIPLRVTPDTFATYLIDRTHKGRIVNPDVIRANYKQYGPEILAAIEEIHKNPPSPILGDLARQVLEGERENILGLAHLLKEGKVVNGPTAKKQKKEEEVVEP